MDHVHKSDDSSDEENFNYMLATEIFTIETTDKSFKRAGAQPERSKNYRRDFAEAHRRLNDGYLGPIPKYSAREFERRFCIPRTIFNKLEEGITDKGIFLQRQNALNEERIHRIMRLTAALRMLAYGVAADAFDEYLNKSEDSILLSTNKFCGEIIKNFGEVYLRPPNEDDLKIILRINTERGFPGCMGSNDCHHWKWKNCPIAWAGLFKGKGKKPTIILEAICDGEFWIWHYFFGSPGILNEINVLDHSSTIGDIISGKYPPSVHYKVNGVAYSLPYYLADRIYSSWAILIKIITDGTTEKERLYASAQKAVRKDIERAFTVLVARFHILASSLRFWYRSDICNIMKACVTIHNMAVEARRDSYESDIAGLRLFERARSIFGEEMNF